jgi:hypothetical protein
MLILLALPVIAAVAAFHRYLQCCAPSNLLARRVRTARPTFPMAVGLLALAAVLLVLMHVLVEAIASGAPGWLNLVVLVLAWDAIKSGMLATLTAMRRGVSVIRRIRRPLRRGVSPTSAQGSAGRGAGRTHVRETSAHAS